MHMLLRRHHAATIAHSTPLYCAITNNNTTAIPSFSSKFIITKCNRCYSDVVHGEENVNNNDEARIIQQQQQQQRKARGFWKEPENRRRFFDDLAKELGLKQPADWYRITTHDIASRGGRTLLIKYYGGSLARALASIYPEHAPQWDASKFSKVPNGFWKDRQNQRRFFDDLAGELNITHLDQWYDITTEHVLARGGRGILLTYYGGSLARALEAIYPDHAWDALRFVKAPNGFWKDADASTHRQRFDKLARDLGIEHLDDWYNVSTEEIILANNNNKSSSSNNNNNNNNKGLGRGLLACYGNSLSRALRAVYPEHPWEPSRFARTPNGFWEDRSNHRRFFDKLGEELGVEKLDDWYDVLNNNNNSNNSNSNNKKKKKKEVLLGAGAGAGAGLINHYYNGSLARALECVYPEHPWQRWRFPRFIRVSATTATATATATDDDTTATTRVLAACVDALAKELGVEHLDDWYRVSMDQIRYCNVGGGGVAAALIHRHGGLCMVLQKLYPQHAWDPKRFQQRNASKKKSSQRQLLLALQKLLLLDSPDTNKKKPSATTMTTTTTTTTITTTSVNSSDT